MAVYVNVTDSMVVLECDDAVHLVLSTHLAGGAFLTSGLILTPDVARRLSEALVGAADAVVQGAALGEVRS